MVLSQKFNTNFSSTQIEDMMLQLVMTSTYGSNSFCFTKAARLMLPTNDAEEPSRPRNRAETAPEHIKNAVVQ